MSEMIYCEGCGFHVEAEDVGAAGYDPATLTCKTCRKCEACPDMRESFRRGYNKGLDDYRRAVDAVRVPLRSSAR